MSPQSSTTRTPSETVVVVGGVAGGMSAATRLRRLNETARIVVLERSGNVSFANCGLPYYAGGVIEDRSALLLQTPESLAARFGIEVRVNTEVTAIDPAAKTLTLRPTAGDTAETAGAGETTLAYDKLLLAPGAQPVRPPIPGFERALSVRTVEDIDAVHAAVENVLAPTAGAEAGGESEGAVASAATAVVVGGGFIGLEMAENLVHRGLDVTVVEALDQVMAPLDPEMAAEVHKVLRNNGIDLRLGVAVSEIGETTVTLADGEVLPADLVIGAIGVRPDSSLAAAAGLPVGDRGGIVVDDQLRTSDPSIWAVGDAVEKVDALDGSVSMVPLANTANLQGRLVADAMNGERIKVRGVAGTAIVGMFGTAIATTGWNEKRLRAAGRDFLAVHTHPINHAGYYPGATGMSLKLLVDPATDEILGAQGIGGDGVDKRIDVIATAMAGGLRGSDLAELELAYSPQYGSAKDPVNMLGYIVRNHREGLVETVQWNELAAEQAAGAVLLDVRTPGEFAAGAIPGAVNVPVDELRERIAEVREAVDAAAGADAEAGGAPVPIVHCAVGLRGYLAVRMLEQLGVRTRNLDGGYRTWSAGVGAEAAVR